MTFLSVLQPLNSCLVLIFGLFLSAHIAGVWDTGRQKKLFFVLCPVFLLLQSAVFLIGGEPLVERFYPLIIHLPIILILTFRLKKNGVLSTVAVLTAYLCCQLPHWGELALTDLTGSPLVGALGYTALIIAAYLLLQRFFVDNAYAAISCSKQTLLLFGSLPLVYYVFDYITTIYSDLLLVDSSVLYEFFPTVLTVFYVVFLAAYHVLMQKRTQAELRSSMLNAELKQSLYEMEVLRQAESQTAVYQHDMRHLLNMIASLLRGEKTEQVPEYVGSVQKDIDAITPKTFCKTKFSTFFVLLSLPGPSVLALI